MDQGNFVFISHSSKNRPEADALCRFFQEKGIKTWLAPLEIGAGNAYMGELTRALKSCACLVLLLSGASQNSRHVLRELNLALKFNKPIVPVQLEDVVLDDNFEYILGTCQIIPVPELREDSRDLARVLAGVRCFVTMEVTGTSDSVFTTEAERKYRKAAEAGDAQAQYQLGECYYHGEDAQEDEEEAMRWYQKAAMQGHAAAQYSLGYCHMNRGETQKEARWFLKAAEQGHAKAQFFLGACYFSGEGVATNHWEAVSWIRKAAEQGLAEAQCFLGSCCCKGIGTTEDRQEGLHWIRRAAEQGNAEAECALGEACVEDGDLKEARKWLQKAVNDGSQDAVYKLESLDKAERALAARRSGESKRGILDRLFGGRG